MIPGLRDMLAVAVVEPGTNVDNLSIALVCYFEMHIDRPQGDEDLLDDNGDSVWVLDRMEKAIELIRDQVEAHIEKQKPNHGIVNTEELEKIQP